MAVLLAAFLNLALLPCAMAFDVVEETHDCCPPEIDLSSSDCCEVDDANVDTRGGSLVLEPDSGGALASVPAYAELAGRPIRHYSATAGPTEPLPRGVPLHKLNCVYLK